MEKLLYAFLTVLPVMQWKLRVCLWGMWNQPPVGKGQFHLPPAQQSDRFKMVKLQPGEVPGEWGFPVEEKQI